MGETTPDGSLQGTELVPFSTGGAETVFPTVLVAGADLAVGAATRMSRLAARVGTIGWGTGVWAGRRVASLPGAERATRLAQDALRPLVDDGRQTRVRGASALETVTGHVLQTLAPRVLDALDVDAVAQQLDIDALVKRIDIDQLVSRIDIDALVRRIDIDALVRRIEIDALVRRIDIDRLVARIDIENVVQQIDIDRLVGRIDIDTLVRRIELDALLRRIDMDHLVASIDMDAIVGRIDVNDVVQRVDIDKVVEETELGTIVSRSTSGFATSALDAARNQTAGVDTLVSRAVNRVLRRQEADLPPGPPLLSVDGGAEATSAPAEDTPTNRPQSSAGDD